MKKVKLVDVYTGLKALSYDYLKGSNHTFPSYFVKNIVDGEFYFECESFKTTINDSELNIHEFPVTDKLRFEILVVNEFPAETFKENLKGSFDFHRNFDGCTTEQYLETPIFNYLLLKLYTFLKHEFDYGDEKENQILKEAYKNLLNEQIKHLKISDS